MTQSQPVMIFKGNDFNIELNRPSFNLGDQCIVRPTYWKKLDKFTLERICCNFLTVREQLPSGTIYQSCCTWIIRHWKFL